MAQHTDEKARAVMNVGGRTPKMPVLHANVTVANPMAGEAMRSTPPKSGDGWPTG
jgi:hypothetical protein